MDSFHEHLQHLHDNELYIGPEDSQHFLEMLHEKHNIGKIIHKCPVSSFFSNTESGNIYIIFGN